LIDVVRRKTPAGAPVLITMDVPSCRGNYSNTDCLELDYKKFVGRVLSRGSIEEKSAARINSPLLTLPDY
jgi:hypothetical protein